MSPRASPPPTTLRGHWLLCARLAWVAVAISALAIVVFSVPSSFEHYSSVCTAASEVCSSDQRVGQPTPEGVRALQDAGLSVRSSSGGVPMIGWRCWSRRFWCPSDRFQSIPRMPKP